MLFLRWTVHVLRSRRGPSAVSLVARPGLEPLETRDLLSGFSVAPPFPVPTPGPAPSGRTDVWTAPPGQGVWSANLLPDTTAPPGSEGALAGATDQPLVGGWNTTTPFAVGRPTGGFWVTNAPGGGNSSASFTLFQEGAAPSIILPSVCASANGPHSGLAADPPNHPGPGSLGRFALVSSTEPSAPHGTPDQGSAPQPEDQVRALPVGSAPTLIAPRSIPIASLVAGVEVAALEGFSSLPRPVSATALAGVVEASTDPAKDSSASTVSPSHEPMAGAGERAAPLGEGATDLPAQADIVMPVAWFGSEPFLVLRQLFHPPEATDNGLPARLTRWLLAPTFGSVALVLMALEVWRWRTAHRNPSATELPEVTGPSGL